MKNTELEQLINEKLNSAAISDYAPNGLQVEGKETVQKLLPVSPPAGLCSMGSASGRGCGHCASWLLLERRVSGHSRNEA